MIMTTYPQTYNFQLPLTYTIWFMFILRFKLIICPHDTFNGSKFNGMELSAKCIIDNMWQCDANSKNVSRGLKAIILYQGETKFKKTFFRKVIGNDSKFFLSKLIIRSNALFAIRSKL